MQCYKFLKYSVVAETIELFRILTYFLNFRNGKRLINDDSDVLGLVLGKLGNEVLLVHGNS